MNTTTEPDSIEPIDHLAQVRKDLPSNILDMALGFTATLRVFEAGSKDTVLRLLQDAFERAGQARSQAGFETIHQDFCASFIAEVRTASKSPNNGEQKPSARASYGHAAKMFDVCAKVWFYYCHLPTAPDAQRVCEYLHTGIDTPILKHLKAQFPKHPVTASTIAEIDAQQYALLQQLANELRAPTGLNAVQFDEWLWRHLNRPQTEALAGPQP